VEQVDKLGSSGKWPINAVFMCIFEAFV